MTRTGTVSQFTRGGYTGHRPTPTVLAESDLAWQHRDRLEGQGRGPVPEGERFAHETYLDAVADGERYWPRWAA